MLRRGAAEPDALTRVYEEHLDAVYGFFAFNLGGDVAEDLSATTFEKVIRNWKRYDARKASERTWILTIARNVLIDHYRQAKHRQSLSLEEHVGLAEGLRASDEGWEERVLGQAELREWLSVLSEREREVIALRYAGDLGAEEIGGLLSLSTANVHQILSRSLRRLRERNSLEDQPLRPTS